MENNIKRFEQYFKKTLDDQCWNWTASKTRDNYGRFYFNNTMMKAHKVSYLLYKGDVTNGMCVCHSCDNPLCVNPEHLWLGTHKENMQDMVNKGRNADIRGDKCVNSKLNWEDVGKIRSFYKNGSKKQNLAHQFNVNFSTITSIINNKTWKI